MHAKAHWESVYRENDPTTDFSWYQTRPAASLRLVKTTRLGHRHAVIDIGGGASSLVDCLLDAGFEDLTVLDISGSALAHARRRLGKAAEAVTWLEADVTSFESARRFDLWHDRAVFHFLTDPEARQSYVRALKEALAPRGWFILGAFAKDGPSRCSGLPVSRHDAGSVQAKLGPEFRLVQHLRETHLTPWHTEQKFAWFCFQRGLNGETNRISGATKSRVRDRPSVRGPGSKCLRGGQQQPTETKEDHHD